MRNGNMPPRKEFIPKNKIEWLRKKEIRLSHPPEVQEELRRIDNLTNRIFKLNKKIRATSDESQKITLNSQLEELQKELRDLKAKYPHPYRFGEAVKRGVPFSKEALQPIPNPRHAGKSEKEKLETKIAGYEGRIASGKYSERSNKRFESFASRHKRMLDTLEKGDEPEPESKYAKLPYISAKDKEYQKYKRLQLYRNRAAKIGDSHRVSVYNKKIKDTHASLYRRNQQIFTEKTGVSAPETAEYPAAADHISQISAEGIKAKRDRSAARMAEYNAARRELTKKQFDEWKHIRLLAFRRNRVNPVYPSYEDFKLTPPSSSTSRNADTLFSDIMEGAGRSSALGPVYLADTPTLATLSSAPSSSNDYSSSVFKDATSIPKNAPSSSNDYSGSIFPKEMLDTINPAPLGEDSLEDLKSQSDPILSSSFKE